MLLKPNRHSWRWEVDLTDEALIEKFRQTKEISFFKALVRRYQSRIYNAALRILGNVEEAEEVVQETFVKVLQNLDKFRNQASFSAWVFRITHNLCVDNLRANQRKNEFQHLSFDPQSTHDYEEIAPSMKVVSQIADPNPGPAQIVDMTEQEQFIADSLQQLPDTQRAVLVLHDIEGFSYQEIAEIIGANIGTVRSRLHYGRLRLKELLDPYFSFKNMSTASR
jgi:RNA polymerase sigma-70 factor (ECF subfamily)